MTTRIDSVRKLFMAEGRKRVNFNVMPKMLDAVEAVYGSCSIEPGSREHK